MIQVEALSKSYQTGHGGIRAVSEMDFLVEEGEFFTLLGPSGCGKSTTLRCVAGLEKPDSGRISIGDVLVYSQDSKVFVPPNKRDIGMVFQSYAIWPHMTVFENVAYPLKVSKRKFTKTQIKERVEKALIMVRLGGLSKRPATQLSGGQQQRLALARAITREPKVLLLDEPLSNLDAKLREEMRIELRDLVRRLKITTLYVTHDQAEALAMSDRIAVMSEGVLRQLGRPSEIYNRPQSKFVAGFIGSANLFPGKVGTEAGKGSDGKVATQIGPLTCPFPQHLNANDNVVISARPERIHLFRLRPDHGENIVEGQIENVVFLGDSMDCRVTVGDISVRLKLDSAVDFQEGDTAFIQILPEICTVIPI